MTNDKRLEIIRECIEDIKAYSENSQLSVNKKQHIVRALETYNNIYEDVQRGKFDPDVLHENIASFLYYMD